MSTRSSLLPGLVAASMMLAACSAAATLAPTAAPTATPTAAPTATPTAAPTAAPTETTDGTLPKPEVTSIKIAATIADAGQFATMLALSMGIYEKYGLLAKVVIFNDDGAVLQEMLSGQADMAQVGVAGIINTVNTDTPAKTIAVQKTKVADGLFCSTDIKIAADVKGKKVGHGPLGSATHASALLALEALKLKDSDVTLQDWEPRAFLLAGLRGGLIDCALISIDLAKDLNTIGMNTVIDLSKSDLQYPTTSMASPVAFMQKNPNTVLAVVASLLEALNYMIKNPTEASTLYAAHAQIPADRALAQVMAVKDLNNPSLKWKKEGFLFTQKVMAIVNPGILNVDVDKAYDMSILQKLEEIGFYTKIGAPTR